MGNMRTGMIGRLLSLVAVLSLLVAVPASAQLKITNAAASAAANAVVDLVDAGPGAGTLRIYGAACPANADDADPTPLLVSLPYSPTAFGAASNGVATASSITTTNAAATGTAQCFRAKDGAAVTVFQGTVTATGGGGQMQLISTSITSGQPVQITSMSYTQPKS